MTEPENDDPVLESLWQRVLDAWDEDKPHNALLDHALRTERLPEIAGRYRALKDDPAKSERVKKRLDAIVVAATHLMFANKTPPRTKVPLNITLTAAGICLVLLSYLAYAILRPH